MRKSILFFIIFSLITLVYYLFSFHIYNYFHSKQVVFWSENVKLQTSDFSGKVNPEFDTNTYCFFGLYIVSTSLKNAEVKAIFDKNKSWIKDTLYFKKDMQFQKLRFDLYEIYARKFNSEIGKIRSDQGKTFADIEKIGDSLHKELLMVEDSLYTSEMTSPQLVKYWQLKIQKLLNLHK